ncbi:MAG TPA: hypothetical protein VGF21_18665 [Thermoleophilaceae bacterium]|jgi:hypothetical protein
MSKSITATAAALFLTLAFAASASAAEPTMPLRDVHQGMRCTGLSVVRGTTISSFDVEVLDVIAAESSSGGPRILVRVSGPAVEPGGIGAGFSGSPVYCRDSAGVRRNAGAISAGVGDYGNLIALVTPIESVLGESPTPPAEARRDPALLRSARSLAGPLTETGLSTRPRRLLVRAARRAGLPLVTVPSGPLAGYPVQTLRPGAAVSTTFASGDISLGAVGTVTYRDGANVWAFGHPLDDIGPRSLMLQDAYVFSVIPNPISSEDFGLGTYKLASSAGHTVGTLTNDADSAVVGRVGPAPRTAALRATAKDLRTGRAGVVNAEMADEHPLGIGTGAATTAPLAAGQAVDDVVHSLQPVTLSMCVRFRIAQRKPRLGFCNDYFSTDDAFLDLTDAATLVDSYDFSPLTLQSLVVRTRLTRGVKEDVLLRGSAPRRVRPGQRIRVRLVVRRRGRGTNRRLSFRMRLPRSLRPGRRSIVLSGTGSSGDAADELADELVTLLIDGTGDAEEEDLPDAHSIGQLSALVSGFHHGQGIRARFRHRGSRRLVYENGRVKFTGSVRIPLRVRRR